MNIRIKKRFAGWLLLVAALFMFNQATAQLPFNKRAEFLNANSRWILDANMGINFNSGNPGTINNTLGRTSKITVSDPATGDLLFYSDGATCFNSNHQVMQNGNAIIGHSDPTIDQSLIVVPVIGQPGKYYLFSLLYPWGTTTTIYYSVIDMSLDNGLGGVVAGQKNIVMVTGNYSNFAIAVPGNNCDVWLITHKQIVPEFRAFHITADGIDTNGVTSITGGQVQGYSPNPSYANSAYQGGTMTISPNRDKLALCTYSPLVGGMLLSKFNPENGVVSDAIHLVSAAECGIQAAFSPDNSKLYMVTNAYNTISYNLLFQWNTATFDSASIAGTRTVVGSNSTYTHLSANRMRLYRDTIYVAHLCYGNPAICNGANKKVSIISAPNLPGTACNYQPGVISLPSVNGFYNTLHPDVIYPLPPDTSFIAHDTMVCKTNNLFPEFALQAAQGGTAYSWDDGSTAATRTITQPGIYRVVTARGFCDYQVDSFTVRQTDMSFSLGEDVSALCGNSTYEIKLPARTGATYQWQDGSNQDKLVVSQPGTYWVTITDNSGCKNSDTIIITRKELIGDLGEDVVLCKGDPIDFKLQLNVPSNTQIRWSTGSQESSITVKEPGVYWVSVKDPLCTDTDTFTVTENICECNLRMPNAFTPNNDGINEFFKPVLEDDCPVSQYAMSIYNRYGQRIFHSSKPDIGWDGNFNGLPSDTGNYFFELHFKGGTRGLEFYRKGDLTLIR